MVGEGGAMSWTYEILTGRMYSDNGDLVGVGYSGAPSAKNDLTQVSVRDVGPIPPGGYSIAAPVDTQTHGPYVMWLTPDPTNLMFGRSAFGIHGDSVVSPGTASEGCIIMSRDVRTRIWNSGDHELRVVDKIGAYNAET